MFNELVSVTTIVSIDAYNSQYIYYILKNY